MYGNLVCCDFLNQRPFRGSKRGLSKTPPQTANLRLDISVERVRIPYSKSAARLVLGASSYKCKMCVYDSVTLTPYLLLRHNVLNKEAPEILLYQVKNNSKGNLLRILNTNRRFTRNSWTKFEKHNF